MLIIKKKKRRDFQRWSPDRSDGGIDVNRQSIHAWPDGRFFQGGVRSIFIAGSDEPGWNNWEKWEKWKCKWGKIILTPSSLEAILPATGGGAYHRCRRRMKFRPSYKNPLLPPHRTALHHLQHQRRLLTSFFAKKVHQAAQACASFNGGPSGDSKG